MSLVEFEVFADGLVEAVHEVHGVVVLGKGGVVGGALLDSLDGAVAVTAAGELLGHAVGVEGAVGFLEGHSGHHAGVVSGQLGVTFGVLLFARFADQVLVDGGFVQASSCQFSYFCLLFIGQGLEMIYSTLKVYLDILLL